MSSSTANSPPQAPSIREPQAELMRYLSPTPDGYSLEYDYLATLRSLIEAECGDVANPPWRIRASTRDWQARNRSCRVRLIDDTASVDHLQLTDEIEPGDPRTLPYIFDQINNMRQKLLHQAQENVRVLVVDRINDVALQIIGAAFDLNPSFFLLHHNEKYGPDRWASKLDELDHRFRSLLGATKRSSDGIDENQRSDLQDPPTTGWEHGVHIRGRASMSSHVGEERHTGVVSSGISCCRVSANGCGLSLFYQFVSFIADLMLTKSDPGLILTKCVADGDFDLRWFFSPPFAPGNGLWYGAKYGPRACQPLNVQLFHEARDGFSLSKEVISSDRALSYRCEFLFGRSPMLEAALDTFDVFNALCRILTMKSSVLNPTRAVSRQNELNLLFGQGSGSLSPSSYRLILPWLLAASQWQDNLRTYGRRLKTLSNQAMLKPSLKTFKPVPALRQDVADAQEALQVAKDSISEARGAAFADRQEIVEHKLQALDAIFETLSKQADALSSAASNEIQLIIGTVTIQVWLRRGIHIIVVVLTRRRTLIQ